MDTYRVLVGLNYPPHGEGAEVRREPGDLVDDLPEQGLPWLLDSGCVELVPPEPWEGYDDQTVSEIVAVLETLTPEQVAQAQVYEAAHKQRVTILQWEPGS